MAAIKFFFLVAGFDYEHGGSRRGLDFNRMCTGRVWERLVFINGRRKKPDAPVTQDTTLRFLRFDVDSDAPQEKLDQLLKLTERYCVVYQTLKNGPPVDVAMQRG